MIGLLARRLLAYLGGRRVVALQYGDGTLLHRLAWEDPWGDWHAHLPQGLHAWLRPNGCVIGPVGIHRWQFV